jgi:PAS domain S-box-containing protein
MSSESLANLLTALQVLFLACLCFYCQGKRKRGRKSGSKHEDQFDLFNESAIAYHDIDPNGIIRRVNKAECALLGYSSEEILGKYVWDLMTPDSRERSLGAIAVKMARGTQSHPFQREFLRRDGVPIITEIHETPLRNDKGEIVGIRAAVLDVTERRRAKDQLEESRERFEQMANTAPVKLWVADEKGRFVFVNKRWLEFTGTRVEDNLGHGWIACVHPEDRDKALQPIETGLRNQSSTRSEYRLRRHDGTYSWVLSSGAPRLGPDSVLRGYLGSVIDISERRATEERLRLLESVVVNSCEGVMVTDRNPDGTILYVNEAFLKMTGYSREQLEGASPSLLHGEETDRGEIARIQSSLMRNSAVQAELLCYRQDRSSFWAETDVIPVLDASGSCEHCVYIQRDVTERKRVENEIQRYARELKEKNLALGSALDVAKEATESKSRFLANMSHEIRTPMNGISGTAELLLTTSLTDEQREYATTIKQSTTALLVVINDILDFSRIEAGKMKIESIPFKLGSLVEETVSLLALAARTKGLAVRCELEVDLPETVHGDPSRLRQVLTNLVGNAIKFTEHGTVALRASRLKGSSPDIANVHFQIEDTGTGIPNDQRARLFERFSQADASLTRKHGGSGLGLAISRQVVELMGGEIGFESLVGVGSTFWFAIPFPVHSGTAAKQEAGQRRQECSSGRTTAEQKVLLAEDNEVNQRIALRILEKSGYRAVAVNNGRAAVESITSAMLAGESYDLVLMDVQMPEMDGFEATNAIRTLEGELHHTPIIAMTANAMAGDRERCLAAGMDDYISKPVSLSQLRIMLDKWIRSDAQTSEQDRTAALQQV